jgi:hypothetical protein
LAKINRQEAKTGMKKNHVKPESLGTAFPVLDAGEFPSTCYFQVHFEHLENLLNEATQCIEALKKQLAEMQAQAVLERVGEAHSTPRSIAAEAHYSLRCDPPTRKSPRRRPPHKNPPSEVANKLRPAPIPELGNPGDSSNC